MSAPSLRGAQPVVQPFMCDFCSLETTDLVFCRCRDFTRRVIIRGRKTLVKSCQCHTPIPLLPTDTYVEQNIIGLQAGRRLRRQAGAGAHRPRTQPRRRPAAAGRLLPRHPGAVLVPHEPVSTKQHRHLDFVGGFLPGLDPVPKLKKFRADSSKYSIAAQATFVASDDRLNLRLLDSERTNYKTQTVR